MSAALKVAKIAELALGKIGAFTVNMLAPYPDDMVRTVQWLDIIVAELAGDTRIFWLTPATTTSALTANVASYTLSALLATDYPADGIIFPIEAYIRDSSGNDSRIDIVSREKYESHEDKTTSGVPDEIYLDRLTSNQKVYFYPVPVDGTYSLRLVFQTFAPNLTSGSPEYGGNLAHGFSSEWNRWLIVSTAAAIGSGPVRRLPLGEIADMRQEAAVSLNTLISYANLQKTNTPRRTKGTM